MKDHQRIRVKAPSQSAVPPIQVKSLQSRPFSPTPNPATQQQSAPSIQAQLDGAKRFGYDLSNISVFPSASAAVQPKLTVGQPGDKYEQEADQVATDVVNRMNMPASQLGQGETVQQKGAINEVRRVSVERSISVTSAEAGRIQRVIELDALQQMKVRATPVPETISAMMRNSQWREIFIAYCKGNWISEVPAFYLAVQNYKNAPTSELGHQIYHEFIKNSATSEINVPSKTKDIVRRSLHLNPYGKVRLVGGHRIVLNGMEFNQALEDLEATFNVDTLPKMRKWQKQADLSQEPKQN
jgi:hypothetical protein